MKKFLITIIFGYAAIALLILVTTQLRGTPGAKNNSQSSSEQSVKESSAAAGSDHTAGASIQQNNGALKPAQATAKVEKEKTIRQFKTYFKNGRVSSEWVFENGRLAHEILVYHENGKKWMEIPVQNDAVHGVFKEFDEEGKLFRSSQFSAGILNGQTTFYYAAGGRSWVSLIFSDGELAERPRFFSEDGAAGDALEAVGLGASPAEESGQGVFRVLSETGDVKAEWSQSGAASAQTAKAYYQDGQASAAWEIKDGKIDGYLTLYRPDGSTWLRWQWAAGSPQGPLELYRANQQLRRTTGFSAGTLDGAQRVFYDDASAMYEMVYDSGRLSHVPRAYSQGKNKSRIPTG